MNPTVLIGVYRSMNPVKMDIGLYSLGNMHWGKTSSISRAKSSGQGVVLELSLFLNTQRIPDGLPTESYFLGTSGSQ